ncbi:hypothetical protein MMC24_004380 [Lignoscripta atroalba]|nr:hypothetical protein [Lignoscripta atroalba]
MATTPTTIKRSCYYFPNIWQPESRISLQYAGDRDLIKSLLTIHQVLDRLINMADNHDQLPQMVNLSLGEDRETSDLSVCSPSEVLERETSLDPATAYFLSLVQSPYSCTETTVIRQKMDLITVCMESDIETYEVAHNNVHTHEAAIRNLEANGDPLGFIETERDSLQTCLEKMQESSEKLKEWARLRRILRDEWFRSTADERVRAEKKRNWDEDDDEEEGRQSETEHDAKRAKAG